MSDEKKDDKPVKCECGRYAIGSLDPKHQKALQDNSHHPKCPLYDKKSLK